MSVPSKPRSADDPVKDDMVRAYFDLLVEKAKSDGADADLLDRIERLLGLPATAYPVDSAGDRSADGGAAS